MWENGTLSANRLKTFNPLWQHLSGRNNWHLPWNEKSTLRVEKSSIYTFWLWILVCIFKLTSFYKTFPVHLFVKIFTFDKCETHRVLTLCYVNAFVEGNLAKTKKKKNWDDDDDFLFWWGKKNVLIYFMHEMSSCVKKCVSVLDSRRRFCACHGILPPFLLELQTSIR